MSCTSEHIDHAIEEFKRQHGLHHVIAFAGGSTTDLHGVHQDDPLAAQYAHLQRERERRIVHDALNALRHYRIAILTSGTRFGFPNNAVEVAQEIGLRTIGVFPHKAVEKGYIMDRLDLSICVKPNYGESAWGDESTVFCKLLDAVIVCGGGAGTLIEMAHLLKMNEALLKYEHALKVIVPIQGTGGVADGLPFMWGKQDIKTACMPHHAVFSGADAAQYILERLDLFTL